PGKALANVDVKEDEQVWLAPAAKAAGAKWFSKTATENVAFAADNRISTWCAGCHENIMDGYKHPQNVPVSTLPDDAGANWVAAVNGSPGFGLDISTAGDEGIPPLRFGQGAGSFASCSTRATSNRVMCLTCHKAHGSKWVSSLNWPHGYRDTTGATTNLDVSAGCQQCHAKY
ncbi:MAG: hypothetical protein WCP21_16170, partial [Armatimonadota bacterium]